MLNKKVKKEKIMKIYLKTQRKPIELVLNDKQAENLFYKIESEVQIIKIGNFIFNKNDFVCAIYE